MQGALRRRLLLLGVLLIVGSLAGGTIAVLEAQKAIQGNNEASISVVKSSDPALPATQRAELQAQHDALVTTLVNIARNDSTVRSIIGGKNYTVVGIGVDKSDPSQGGNVTTALLVIKVDGAFYAIVEDVPQKQVTAVEQRICYGPGC
ncbi:MAG: hypothetical protein ACXVI3_01255 [Halobacteriota archaeon]